MGFDVISSHHHRQHSLAAYVKQHIYMHMLKSKYIIVVSFENVHFFYTRLGLYVCLDMKSPHISLNTARSDCKPSIFMSSFTHSPSLPAPASTLHPKYLHISTPLLRFRCISRGTQPKTVSYTITTTTTTLNTQKTV